MKTLITFVDNWADEMDFNSHLICGEKDLEVLQKIQKYDEEDMKKTNSIYIGLGSNEGNEYDNAYELYQLLDIVEISDEEAQIVNKHFGTELGAASIDYILRDILEALESIEK